MRLCGYVGRVFPRSISRLRNSVFCPLAVGWGVSGFVQQGAEHVMGGAAQSFAADHDLGVLLSGNVPAAGGVVAPAGVLAVGAAGDDDDGRGNVRVPAEDLQPGVFQELQDRAGGLAEDRMAEMLAKEVIQASTDFDGTERAPMRLAEARMTLGVVAARQGDLEQAIHYGERALTAPRKSLPSLLMVSRDLTRVLNDQHPNEPETQAYLDRLHTLSS